MSRVDTSDLSKNPKLADLNKVDGKSSSWFYRMTEKLADIRSYTKMDAQNSNDSFMLGRGGIMVVLYDFAESMSSQISIKRGQFSLWWIYSTWHIV